jgi:hypothetical protein
MSKRAETKAAKREALIRAGMSLFAKKGLDAPSLDETASTPASRATRSTCTSRIATTSSSR